MIIIQLTGLSGAGKSTIAQLTAALLEKEGRAVEIIDGDEYRKTICSDLGFSPEDRQENIRRLGTVAYTIARQGRIAIIAAINPYAAARNELATQYGAKTVWVNCTLEELVRRDTKGLYKRALLPDGAPGKILNLTGVNDTYEPPLLPDLVLETAMETPEESAGRLCAFICSLQDV